jgi:glycosyltransferase involved in cell wall biosynthesis
MAPTHWGVRMLEGAGIKNPMYLPCAHDPRQFYVMPSKEEARKKFSAVINKDLTDKYVVNVVSCNAGGRKNYQAIFHAWSIFSKSHPDAILYLHTDITGYFAGGNDLVEMCKAYGVHDESVIHCSQWEYATGQIGEDYLNLMYNATDLHLNCCYGEGFGLPIMDAQAAGCPTLVPDFAAASEVGQCMKISVGMPYMTVPKAMQFMVDPAAVAHGLEMAYSERHLVSRKEIAATTVPWQVDNVVSEYLVPVLARMEAEK